MVVIGLVLYCARGPIGTLLVQQYLRDHGVPATIVFEELGADGFVAHGVFGPANDPDLTVERVEVTFEPIIAFAEGGLVPRLRSVRLVRPRLKAALVDGRLRFGSLQRLLDEVLANPGGKGPNPAIVVEGGDLRLSTPAGDFRVGANAALDKGRLTRLAARLYPTVMHRGDLGADITGATLTARSQGAGLAVSLDLVASRVSMGEDHADKLHLAANGVVPYPGPSLDGPVNLSISATAGALASASVSAAAPKASLTFAGVAHGPLDRVSLRGAGATSLSAGGWTAPGAISGAGFDIAGLLSGLTLARSTQGLRLGLAADLSGALGAVRTSALEIRAAKVALRAHGLDALIGAGKGTLTSTTQLSWDGPALTAGPTRLRQASADLSAAHAQLTWSNQGWSLSSPLHVKAKAAELVQPLAGGALSQRALAVDMAGDGRIGTAPAHLSLQGSVRSAGGGVSPAAAKVLAQSVPILATDVKGLAALEGALREVRIDAPALALSLGANGPVLGLPRPLDLIGADGAHARLSAPGPRALTLTAGGAGLPDIVLDVPTYTAGLDRSGLLFTADTHLKLGFSGSSMTGLVLALPARTSRKLGTLAVTQSDCGDVALAGFGAGPKPLVTQLTARLCPEPGKPLLTLASRAWSLGARITSLQFTAPDSEAAIRDAAARLDLHGDGSGQPVGGADLEGGRIVDVAKVRRFEPLGFKGRADLARGVWTGPLQISDAAKSRPVVQVRFTHTMETASGHADIAAPRLVFARDGLQPRDLSPIGADMVSAVEGAISFTGMADWGPAGLTSSGKAGTAGIDLRSPLGPVKQVKADMTFTSLAPLITAPDQAVSARQIDAAVPITAPSAKVALKADRITLTALRAEIARGVVTLDPLDMLFDPAAALKGVVRIDGIDLADLIERFNLADKVIIQAKINGVLPFTFANGAIRLDGGRVFASGPGRLTIRPEALSGATAASAPGAPAAATPPTMQTFAYQAMEDLAFDKLEAEVGSQPMGRLGVLFRINGRHDPPTGGEARIGIFDLIRGKAFDKPIDLPKGTPVNLTLDTSLNLDQLLADYAGRGRSEPVQPASGKP